MGYRERQWITTIGSAIADAASSIAVYQNAKQDRENQQREMDMKQQELSSRLQTDQAQREELATRTKGMQQEQDVAGSEAMPQFQQPTGPTYEGPSTPGSPAAQGGFEHPTDLTHYTNAQVNATGKTPTTMERIANQNYATAQAQAAQSKARVDQATEGSAIQNAALEPKLTGARISEAQSSAGLNTTKAKQIIQDMNTPATPAAGQGTNTLEKTLYDQQMESNRKAQDRFLAMMNDRNANKKDKAAAKASLSILQHTADSLSSDFASRIRTPQQQATPGSAVQKVATATPASAKQAPKLSAAAQKALADYQAAPGPNARAMTLKYFPELAGQLK